MHGLFDLICRLKRDAVALMLLVSTLGLEGVADMSQGRRDRRPGVDHLLFSRAW